MTKEKLRIGDKIHINKKECKNKEFNQVYEGDILTIINIDEVNNVLYTVEYPNLAVDIKACYLEQCDIVVVLKDENNKYYSKVVFTGTYHSALMYMKYIDNNNMFADATSLGIEQHLPPFLM